LQFSQIRLTLDRTFMAVSIVSTDSQPRNGSHGGAEKSLGTAEAELS
jgi:hypothetical protein